MQLQHMNLKKESTKQPEDTMDNKLNMEVDAEPPIVKVSELEEEPVGDAFRRNPDWNVYQNHHSKRVAQ